jgi:DNA repair ATPase RecN
MSQTKSIKIRLSPIMERMKDSLDKIQALEVTLDASEPEVEQDSIRSRRPENDKARVHAKSRELLTHSMEMLHRKLGRLSQMEIDCDVAEDRRQELQHHFLQASTNMPSRELATTRQRNLQLESQVSQLEEVVHQLGRKCTKVDHLQQEVDSLSEQLQKLESVQKELYESTTKCGLLEKDFEQRQSKLIEQSERSDDLEYQVKQLNVMCSDLLQTLATREAQNEVLVQQLRHEQQEEGVRGW